MKLAKFKEKEIITCDWGICLMETDNQRNKETLLVATEIDPIKDNKFCKKRTI